jgi:Bifunctional DNA primase/polymerase, N-terminal
MSNDLPPPENDDGRPPSQGPTDAEESSHSTPNIPKFSGHTDDLIAEAIAIRELGASVISAGDIGAYAIEYAVNNWAIFPLRGKIPAIPKTIGGRGVLDATTDIATIAQWWGGRYRGCNIGGRVPDSMIVIDIDPYHGGEEHLAKLEAEHGKLPLTYMHLSGRGDGGRHLFFRHPGGDLTAKRLLRTGLDLRTNKNYTVLPPSVHPDTGQPYTRAEAPVAAPPRWLVELLRPEQNAHRITPTRPRSPLSGHLSGFFSGSIADNYCQSTAWPEILMPHGWSCIDPDPDADGAKWVHPTATAKWSATIKHGLLFVYSTNTPFQVTEAGNAKGYTKFRAHAVLNHGGDLSAAARALMAAVI